MALPIPDQSACPSTATQRLDDAITGTQRAIELAYRAGDTSAPIHLMRAIATLKSYRSASQVEEDVSVPLSLMRIALALLDEAEKLTSAAHLEAAIVALLPTSRRSANGELDQDIVDAILDLGKGRAQAGHR